MKTVLSLAAAMSLMVGAAQAGEWRVVSTTDEFIKAVDYSSFRRNSPTSDVWRVWTAVIYRNSGSRNYDFFVSREEIDCREDTVSYLTTSYYTVGGEVLSSDNRPTEAEYIIPDTISDYVFRAVCQGMVFREGTWERVDSLVNDYRGATRGR